MLFLNWSNLLVYVQDRALKLYNKHLARKSPDPIFVEVFISKITKPFLKISLSQV